VANSSHKKLFFAAIYIIFITLFDVFSYGVIYQQKLQKENYRNPVLQWVFEEKTTGEGLIEVPRYRVIQKTLEIAGILLIFIYCGLPAAIGLVISHYLLTYDFLYYVFLNEIHTVKNFDNTFITYWLVNWYQSGYFILKPFNHVYFYISGIAGIVIALLSGFIPVREKSLFIPSPFRRE